MRYTVRQKEDTSFNLKTVSTSIMWLSLITSLITTYPRKLRAFGNNSKQNTWKETVTLIRYQLCHHLSTRKDSKNLCKKKCLSINPKKLFTLLMINCWMHALSLNVTLKKCTRITTCALIASSLTTLRRMASTPLSKQMTLIKMPMMISDVTRTTEIL